MRTVIVPERAAKRALENVAVDAETGCWVSLYSVASHGYAQIGWQSDAEGRGMTTAHRAAWTAVHGQIPDGMTIDHLCRNRRCVNPDHLRMLSNFENARRTSGRDWPLGQCVNGHPNSELRLVGKKAACRICYAEWRARSRAKKQHERTSAAWA